MTPMPVNPVVVVQRDINGNIVGFSSNIGNDLNVVLVSNDTDFNRESLGKPFNSKVPVQPTQVLAMRKK